jgi:hypothetical protein
LTTALNLAIRHSAAHTACAMQNQKLAAGHSVVQFTFDIDTLSCGFTSDNA